MKPNLSYIKKIADNNEAFQKKLILIIKREFPQEKKEFSDNFKSGKFHSASENVHKLKHKINIFGLETGYRLAVQLENELNNGKFDSVEEFIVILNSIENYLEEI
jgi:HPt (histidine-containing phosphotransfer) domain-containing protein